MQNYELVKEYLKKNQKTWLVTGAAGFIGSHLVETLLKLNQKVVGVDNLSTGDMNNMLFHRSRKNFNFIPIDIRSPALSIYMTKNIDIVLHQAALGSVPRSIKDPIATHDSNVNGTMHILNTCRLNNIKRVVYASSSSVYGDSTSSPKVENITGNPLSPYAVTKKTCELLGHNFHHTYGLECIGLRYFNVFGPRQAVGGEYSAVIPTFIKDIIDGKRVTINGDGETSRDFCYVDNVVQANILAGLTDNEKAYGQNFNIACGKSTSLNEIHKKICLDNDTGNSNKPMLSPEYKDFRAGDVKNSLADISLAKKVLNYEPEVFIDKGLSKTIDWYLKQ